MLGQFGFPHPPTTIYYHRYGLRVVILLIEVAGRLRDLGAVYELTPVPTGMVGRPAPYRQWPYGSGRRVREGWDGPWAIPSGINRARPIIPPARADRRETRAEVWGMRIG